MSCNCNDNCGNGNRFVHIALTVATATNYEITTSNNDNINDKDPYILRVNQRIINGLPSTPLATTIGVNGTQVPLLNKYGVQILSSAIPKRAFGYYSEETTPHVILINTPETVTIP